MRHQLFAATLAYILSACAGGHGHDDAGAMLPQPNRLGVPLGTFCNSTSTRSACFAAATTVVDAQRFDGGVAASLTGARPGYYGALSFSSRSPIFEDGVPLIASSTITDLACDASGCREFCSFGGPDGGIAWQAVLYKFDVEEWEGELNAALTNPSVAADPSCTSSTLRIWFRVKPPP